jgi:hypothetical protein
METTKMKKTGIAQQVLVGALLTGLLTACAAADKRQMQISNVYVKDFQSDDKQLCRPSDVPLDNKRARDFFRRARQVDYKVIFDGDDYPWAPCYVEGTLKYRNSTCKWEIRAGATGQIKCDKKTRYFVCDDCEGLFRKP